MFSERDKRLLEWLAAFPIGAPTTDLSRFLGVLNAWRLAQRLERDGVVAQMSNEVIRGVRTTRGKPAIYWYVTSTGRRVVGLPGELPPRVDSRASALDAGLVDAWWEFEERDYDVFTGWQLQVPTVATAKLARNAKLPLAEDPLERWANTSDGYLPPLVLRSPHGLSAVEYSPNLAAAPDAVRVLAEAYEVSSFERVFWIVEPEDLRSAYEEIVQESLPATRIEFIGLNASKNSS